MTCESCERLRAERNRRFVTATELGALSERLEEDNAATDASLVRSAMHELERLRADSPSHVMLTEFAHGLLEGFVRELLEGDTDTRLSDRCRKRLEAMRGRPTR